MKGSVWYADSKLFDNRLCIWEQYYTKYVSFKTENINVTSQSSEDVNTKTAQQQVFFQWTLSWLVDRKRYPIPHSKMVGRKNCRSKRGGVSALNYCNGSFLVEIQGRAMFLKYILVLCLTFHFLKLCYSCVSLLVRNKRFRPAYIPCYVCAVTTKPTPALQTIWRQHVKRTSRAGWVGVDR